jgi:WhiB family transcriptional regulator, redox-sensing transcriptional regulator
VAFNRAISVCESCPVREACLEEAMRSQERFGVWGGLGAVERERRRRRLALYERYDVV